MGRVTEQGEDHQGAAQQQRNRHRDMTLILMHKYGFSLLFMFVHCEKTEQIQARLTYTARQHLEAPQSGREIGLALAACCINLFPLRVRRPIPTAYTINGILSSRFVHTGTERDHAFLQRPGRSILRLQHRRLHHHNTPVLPILLHPSLPH